MFYLQEQSLKTELPIFQRLTTRGLFFPEKQIAYDFANTGVYERSLIDWALAMMDPTKVFIDIGAHVGTWTLPFAKQCAGVHSFECCPRTHNFLCANVALRGLDYDVTIHKTALGNHTGTLPYYFRSEDGGGNSCIDFKDKVCESIQVPITTLDSFNLNNIGLIKIDVEGFEKEVFEGMQETLKRNGYPKILFESWRESRDQEGIPATKLRKELFDYVRSIGYDIIPVRGWDEMFIAERNTDTTST